jgi:hypothetical protein
VHLPARLGGQFAVGQYEIDALVDGLVVVVGVRQR